MSPSSTAGWWAPPCGSSTSPPGRARTASTWRTSTSSPSSAAGAWGGRCWSSWPGSAPTAATPASNGPCSTGTRRPSASTARSAPCRRTSGPPSVSPVRPWTPWPRAEGLGGPGGTEKLGPAERCRLPVVVPAVGVGPGGEQQPHQVGPVGGGGVVQGGGAAGRGVHVPTSLDKGRDQAPVAVGGGPAEQVGPGGHVLGRQPGQRVGGGQQRGDQRIGCR